MKREHLRVLIGTLRKKLENEKRDISVFTPTLRIET